MLVRFRSVVRVAAVLLVFFFPVAASAGKKVRTVSNSAAGQEFEVFAQSISRLSKVVTGVEKKEIVTMGTAIWTQDRTSVLDVKPENGDHFVGVTVVVSASPALRQTSLEEWKARRLRSLVDKAWLVFPDGSTIAAQVGSGYTGLKTVDGIAWAPGTIMTDAEGRVVYRNYITQKKDEFLGTETLYFPVQRAAWKSAKPVAMKIGDAEIRFELKKWPE